MILSRMMKIRLYIFGILLSIVYGKKYLYCTNDYKLEPDIGDLVLTLVGANITNSAFNMMNLKNKASYETITELVVGTIYEVIGLGMKKVVSQEVPVMKVISDGVFAIDWNSVNFDDVYIIQKNHFIMSAICQLVGSKFDMIQTTFCRCWKGDYVSGKSLGLIPKNSYMDYSYCHYRPCTDSRLAMGDCHVQIDPFRHACIQIYSPLDNIPPSVVTYNSTIPTMTRVGSFFQLVTESFQRHIDDMIDPPKYLHSIMNIFRSIGIYSEVFFSYTPKYLFNLIIGAFLYIHSDSLASSRLFQYTLVGSLGLILALAWIVYSIYRLGSNMIKSYIPFPSTTLAAGLFASSYLLTNQELRNFVMNTLWAFWDDGTPFGVKWLGKAYFFGSFLLSILITKLFGLFSSTSTSLEVLRYSLKIISLFLLSRSSSSQEIAAIILSIVVFKDDIEYFLWSSYLTTQSFASTPTSYYTGRQISMKEYEVEGEEYTKRELEKLQVYLKQNPEEANKYMDKFREGDKMIEASTLLRFVHHGYSGRPSKNEALVVGRKYRYHPVAIVLLVVLAISLIVIFYSLFTGSLILSKLQSKLSWKIFS